MLPRGQSLAVAARGSAMPVMLTTSSLLVLLVLFRFASLRFAEPMVSLSQGSSGGEGRPCEELLPLGFVLVAQH